MRSIEKKIDIPDSRKDDFRREIMNYIGALALDGKKFEYNTNARLYRALELKLFEDQRDTIKLKNLVSSVVDDETQQKIDIVKQRLIKNFGYNEISATDVLNYVASIFARGDAGDQMFAILSGRVRLTLSSARGREIVLRPLGPLDILGEMAARNLTRVAISITTLDRRLARSMEPRAATPVTPARPKPRRTRAAWSRRSCICCGSRAATTACAWGSRAAGARPACRICSRGRRCRRVIRYPAPTSQRRPTAPATRT